MSHSDHLYPFIRCIPVFATLIYVSGFSSHATSLQTDDQPTVLSEIGDNTRVGGFYLLPGLSRHAYDMSRDWRLHVGQADDAHSETFDASQWSVIDKLGHIPLSSDVDQGIWLRKKFIFPETLHRFPKSKLRLRFDTVPAQTRFWLNGELIAESSGGGNPMLIDVSERLRRDGRPNTLVLCAVVSIDKSTAVMRVCTHFVNETDRPLEILL